jgi:DNA polymerase III epsilon subunit family exonuclease
MMSSLFEPSTPGALPQTPLLAHQPVLPDDVVAIDVETTGLDYKTEKIIEIAAVRITNGQIVATYDSLVNPEIRIRHSSFKVHGISEDMLVEAPTIEKVLPDFLAFLGDSPFVAHNAIFDYTFINQACKATLGKRLENRRIDTFDMYRTVFPDDPSHGLASLAHRFGVVPTDRHRALADAHALALVYTPLRKLYVQKLAWQLNQIEQIDYMLERYLRCQKMIQVLQGEMSDLKDIFKLYFAEGGKPVMASTGEELFLNKKRGYTYNEDAVLPVLIEAGLVKKAYKINTRNLDKLIENRGKLLTPQQREALIEARTGISESKSIQVAVTPAAKSVQTPDDLTETASLAADAVEEMATTLCADSASE